MSGSIKSSFLFVLSVFSMIYLVFVGTGAYNIILSYLAHVVHVPEAAILTSQHSMSFFLAVSLLYTFITTPPHRGGRVGVADYILGLVAFVAAMYRFIAYQELSLRIGITTTTDVIFGILTVILMVEAIRRKVGVELAAIVALFALYGLLDSNFNIKMFIERIYLFNIGIYSTPLQVAVLMISVFLLFGALLDRAGSSDYFTKLAIALTGKMRGGPAKVTTVATALLGTSTGSATGATSIIGTITIPSMIRAGFTAEIAAAITAACGTGSQIMPPVLGSAGFIMPLYLGTTYWYVVVASIIPALLYYLYLFLYVDLMAIKLGLKGLPESEVPGRREVLRELYMFAPVLLLVYLLATGFEAESSALAALVLVILIASLRLGKPVGIPVTVATAVTLLALAALTSSITSAIFLTSAFLVLGSALIRLIKDTRGISDVVTEGLYEAFRLTVPIVLTCAGAGIIAGVLSLSGLSYTLGRAIWEISGGNIYVALVMVMLISILLGFGLPTPVVYVTTVSILGPMAAFFNVPPIVLHYFIFFFGVFAPLTPPVALASYAAAGIAKSNFWKTGLNAFTMTIASWVIAWAFVLRPNMLLVTIAEGSYITVLETLIDVLVTAAVLVSVLIAYTGVTWGRSRLPLLARIAFATIAALGLTGLLFRFILPLFAVAFITSLLIFYVKKGEKHAPQILG